MGRKVNQELRLQLIAGHEHDTKVCKHCKQELPYEEFVAWNGKCVLGVCHDCATAAAKYNARGVKDDIPPWE